MRTLLLLLLVAVAIVVALFALGVFKTSGDPDDPSNQSDERSTSGTGDEGPGMAGLPPGEQPTLVELAPTDDVNILLLAKMPDRVSVFLARHWDAHPKMSVMSWSAPPPAETAGSGVPPAERLPGARPEAPTAMTLGDEGIDVVVVHNLDPGVLDSDFWHEVAEGVKEGRLGLLVVPGVESGHTQLDHPVLGGLLPVAKAKPISGQPLPGVFNVQVPFRVTEAGESHPASRLVPWPSWSRKIWLAARTLPTPWGTKFAYPVEELREGAQTLVEVDPAHGDVWPALIAGDPEAGRVLWMGHWDFGAAAAYGRPDVVSDWQTLVRNWVTWLAGQAE